VTTQPGDESLDFSAPADAPGAPICIGCNKPIVDAYWAINGKVVCADCKAQVENAVAHGTRAGGFGRGLLYGIGGMLGGSIIWYAVAKLANLEIGLIAILLGWMVGKAVHAGSGHRGGLKFQLLAVGLTYLGISLAYTPFLFEAFSQMATSDSTQIAMDSLVATGDSFTLADSTRISLDSVLGNAASDSAAAEPVSPIVAFGALGIAILSLPVLIVVGDFPASLLSVIIYAIAFYEAWKFPRKAQLDVSGPFKVSAAVPA
jgi:hypothetical protein